MAGRSGIRRFRVGKLRGIDGFGEGCTIQAVLGFAFEFWGFRVVG